MAVRIAVRTPDGRTLSLAALSVDSTASQLLRALERAMQGCTCPGDACECDRSRATAPFCGMNTLMHTQQGAHVCKHYELWTAFPPRQLSLQVSASSTLADLGFAPGSISLMLCAATAQPSDASVRSAAECVPASRSASEGGRARDDTGGPPRRVAAARALELMPRMAQEAARMDAEARAKAATGAQRARARAEKSARSSAGAARVTGVHTLHSAGTKRARTGSVRSFTGTGRSLQGDVVHVPTADDGDSDRPRRRARLVVLASTEADLGAQLVSAMHTHTHVDATTAFLRAAAQCALGHEHEHMLACARVAAARSGSYEVRPCGGRVLGHAHSHTHTHTHLLVRFRGDTRERKMHEDVVENLPRAAVLATLRSVAGSGEDAPREAMKPTSTARISPRMFWAIIRYGSAAACAPGAVTPVKIDFGSTPVQPEEAYHRLLPDIDWSFLDMRARKMTERALAAAAMEAVQRADREARRRRRLGLPDVVADTAAPASTVDLTETEAPPSADVPEHGPSTALLCAALIDTVVDSRSSAAAPAGSYVDAASSSELVARAYAVLLQRAPPTAALPDVPKQLCDQTFDVVSTMLGQHPEIASEACAALLKLWPFPPISYAVATSDEVEERTVICERCERSRFLVSTLCDLAIVDECEDWTCDTSSIPQLVSRGGCQAPDDELCGALGSELSAAVCTQCDLATPVAVASAILPEDESVEYAGPECLPIPPEYTAAIGISSQRAGSLDAGSRRARRVPSLASLVAPVVMGDEEARVAAHQQQQLQLYPKYAAWLPPSSLSRQHAGYKLVFAAACCIIAAGSDSARDAVRLCQDAVAAASAVLTVKHSALAFLMTTAGWLVSAALAREWQSFARGQLFAEVMAGAVSRVLKAQPAAVNWLGTDGGSDEQAACDALLSMLSELQLNTPGDVLRLSSDAMAAALRSAAAHRVAQEHPEVAQEVATELLEACQAVVREHEWMADVLTA